LQGLSPEIIPSTFEEDLVIHDFENVHEYPVATASHKAVEVYERLVVRRFFHTRSTPASPKKPVSLLTRQQSFSPPEQRENPDDGPDLVIAADTVVFTHAPAPVANTDYSMLPPHRQELLEKPLDKADNLRMLMDLNGAVCEVVTGVSLGEPKTPQGPSFLSGAC